MNIRAAVVEAVGGGWRQLEMVGDRQVREEVR